MQLMPQTAKEVGVSDLTNPLQNLIGGTKYMEKILNRFDKTIPLIERYHFALASYNADMVMLLMRENWQINLDTIEIYGSEMLKMQFYCSLKESTHQKRDMDTVEVQSL